MCLLVPFLAPMLIKYREESNYSNSSIKNNNGANRFLIYILLLTPLLFIKRMIK